MTNNSKGISKIKELSRGYIIEIPSRFSISTFLFIIGTVLFLIWQLNKFFFGLIPSAKESGLGIGGAIALLVCFLFLMFFLFIIINLIMYLRNGKEVILIDEDKMVIRSEGDFLGGETEFDLKIAKNFDANFQPQRGYYSGMNYNMLGKRNRTGTIKFDYGMKTYRFGIYLEEAEGRYILDLLRAKKLIMS